MDLTGEQKVQVTMEMLKNQPLETIGLYTLLKLSDIGIAMNSDATELSCKGIFSGKNYNCKMLITWEEIK